jgi:segregation and condensation protein B
VTEPHEIQSSIANTAEDPGLLKAKIEAIIFAAPEPVSIADIIEFLGEDSLRFMDIKRVLKEISDELAARPHGAIELVKGPQGYQFQTQRHLTATLERIFLKKPRPLSRASQETLAIIAYRQPVSRSDVEFIRGTDSGSIINTLLEKNLVACVGRKELPGKPMLFGTTPEFLKVYGLSSVDDLPKIESFQPRKGLVKEAETRIQEAQQLEQVGENAPPLDDTPLL